MIGHHIWLARLGENQPRPVTQGRSINGHPAWLPDGFGLVHFASRPDQPEPDWQPSAQFRPDRGPTALFRLDTRTGRSVQPTDGLWVDERPAVSADGAEIAFVSNRAGSLNIWRMAIDGSGIAQVTRGPGLDYRPALSPDGRSLAYFSRQPRTGRHLLVLAA